MIEILRTYTGRFEIYLHRENQPTLVLGFNLEVWEAKSVLEEIEH